MNDAVHCTEMYLPDALREAAGLEAISQNPANRPALEALAATSLILPKTHIAALITKKWPAAGVTLTVGFLEYCPSDIAKMILEYANRWAPHCSIKFAMTQTDPQVRITRSGQGYWSYLGTDILSIPRNQATMCLQGVTMQMSMGERDRVIVHEFGHTMGFPHEHMRKDIIADIDPQKAYDFYWRTQRWDKQMVDSQVLRPLEESSIMGSPQADVQSIMTYQAPGSITKSGRPIPGGMMLSAIDKQYVAQIYPLTSAPPVEPPIKPPVVIGDMAMTMDFTAKKVRLRLPSGWNVDKLATTDGDPAVETNRNELKVLGDELNDALPQGQALDDARQSALLGGPLGKLIELVSLLRSGTSDFRAIGSIVYDLLGMLLGKTGATVGDGGGISFSPAAAGFKLNWARIVGVLQKLLPIILGELMGA